MADNENMNTETENTTPDTHEPEAQETQQTDNAELARLKADIVKQKAAIDKATKEAAEYKRLLRAKQSEAEIAAEAEKERQEADAKELEALRREKAVSQISTRMFAFTQDEKASDVIAEALYGADDIDLAMDELNKLWVAREKALKLEYGKIPAPGVGSANSGGMTKTEIFNIKDAAARQKAIAENIHLFR